MGLGIGWKIVNHIVLPESVKETTFEEKVQTAI